MLTSTTQESGTSSVDVGMVPPLHVPMLWAQIEPILKEKGEDWLTTVSEEEVLGFLYTGQLDIWCGMDNGELDGFVICHWEKHARANYYHIDCIAGKNLDKYFALGMQKIERYACIMGAAEVVMEGRKAWTRLLGPRGYVPRTVRLRKNVRTLWSN